MEILKKNTKNEAKHRKTALMYGTKHRPIKEVTQNELLVFLGLMVMAQIVGRHGDIWDKFQPEGVRLEVNVENHMTQYHFD